METKLVFLKGGENPIKDKNYDSDAKRIKVMKDNLAQAMGAKNLSFLFGSGCSSFIKEGQEIGIKTMRPLAKDYISSISDTEKESFKNIGIEITNEEYSSNLEHIMEVLFSAHYYLSNTVTPSRVFGGEYFEILRTVGKLIDSVKKFILAKCHNEKFYELNNPVIKVYEGFYRKLVTCREKSLSRPWIFTTNYDICNEIALDFCSIQYANGFSGLIDRSFNPATFRYSLSQELGTSNRKWGTIDSYVYLCKLHGSINWVEDNNVHGLFPIKELQKVFSSQNNRVMIYPTPLKNNSSFSSPYSDLFREFQTKLLQEQGVLIVIGYSFQDEHINNIIYRALTIPSFKLIILADSVVSGELKKLKDLKDPRIWFIGGEYQNDEHASEIGKIHYFNQFVEQLMPSFENNSIENATQKIREILIQPNEVQEEIDEVD